MNYNAIPQELKQLKNWVCWKAEKDERSHSGISKKPINPRTGGFAMSNNPDTWTDFDTAAREAVKYSGIGFMFGGSGYFGVDIDDMPEELEKFANGQDGIISEFVNTLQSYTEYSQSHTGIHIICRGKLPDGGRKKKHSFGGFEMYDKGRFFVMTGECCSEFAELNDCTESIKLLHSKYIGGGKEPKAKKPKAAAVPLSANELIKKACEAKNGAAFQALYYVGDLSNYGSQSEADLALCNILAFWTGCDAALMDSLFRSSALMREKWDRKQKGTTYGAITIQKAIEGCTEVYKPSESDGYSLSIGSGSKGDNGAGQKLYTFDDMGNAKRFIDLFGENLRYCYTEKKWYFYDTRKWCVDNQGMVEGCADEAVEAMKLELNIYAQKDANEGTDQKESLEKHIKKSRANRAKKAMLNEAQHYVPILPAQMDKHRMALNTPSGVVNLKTGELTEHKPEYYFTKITSSDIGSAADCPRWLQFLDEIFDGDKDLIRYIQKALGYSLTGSTKEQCVFFLFGTGRNGKSTFIDVVRDVFGDYAANIQPETIMKRTNNGLAINSDIARLKGARFVTSVEPNEGARLNEGLIKQLTGDDTVTARKLYAEEFEFKPEFKLWMATNHKPIIRGTDTGIWRRIHMIPFTVCIPEDKVDKNLSHKLKAEMSSIFKWIVDGCALWQKEGLKMPAAVLEITKEYRKEMDVISVFLESECCREGATAASILYQAYSEWGNTNHEFVMSRTQFGIELSKRNFEKVHTRSGYIYNGISLIKDEL